MNCFANDAVARRYAEGRPYFHPVAVDKIRGFTGITKVSRAIDVCCGTGLSTVALRDVAETIVGIDLAEDMLNQVPPNLRITWVRGLAENLPVASGSADLMTLSMGHQWINGRRFLAEAFRVLRDNSWLAVYSLRDMNGEMEGNPDYERWVAERFVKRYPLVFQNNSILSKKDLISSGFEDVGEESFEYEMHASVEDLARCFNSRTDVMAAVREGRETFDGALAWTEKELVSLFKRKKETVLFSGSIWYLQKKKPSPLRKTSWRARLAELFRRQRQTGDGD